MLSGYAYKPVTWKSSLSGKQSTIGLIVDMTAEERYAQFNYTTTNKNGDSTKQDKTSQTHITGQTYVR